MFFNREKKKSNFVKAKTPKSRARQKAAIVAYYTNKKEMNVVYIINGKTESNKRK